MKNFTDELPVIGNVAAFIAMLVAAVAWVVFGGRWPAGALCIGTIVGLFVFTALAYTSLRHHSRMQPRDDDGRFVPVKNRGKMVGTVRIGGDEGAGR